MRFEAKDLMVNVLAARASAGHLPRLALSALSYGASLKIADVRQLAARLYFFNRIPASAGWRRRLPDPEAVRTFLGIDEPSLASLLAAHRMRVARSSGDITPWLEWRRAGTRPQPRPYKLYVSPMPSDLRTVIPLALQLLAEHGALSMKVGGDIYGLLRPDKLVAYFDTADQLSACASALADRVPSVAVHGVPFTAELARDGLLSWGMDPPPSEQLPGWDEHQSWRSWLTNRLAAALLAYRTTPISNLSAWQFAMERLWLDGVDTEQWAPARPRGSASTESAHG